MSEAAATNSAGDIAGILKDYVPKADHEALLDAYAELDNDHKTHKSAAEKHALRVAELEKKVRGSAAKSAYDKIAGKLKVNEKFRDHVFKLAEIPSDADEPDERKLEAHLAAWLKDNPDFVTEETPAPTKIPAGEGASRGRSAPAAPGKMQVTQANVRDAKWMRDNGAEFRKAEAANLLEFV
jgi:hypothetical protein